MYQPVAPIDVLNALVHIRGLYRKARHSDERARLAHAAREEFAHSLIGNFRRSESLPTPRILFELSRHFRLTTEGAYRLFGYDLSKIQENDFLLNSHRTRIIESYPFRRDQAIEVPALLGPDSAFSTNALLRDLVVTWQSGLPIRSIQGETWQRNGVFYIQTGITDSLGSPLPAGAIASVEPIGREESMHPNPQSVYLLLFGDGARCCRCKVSQGKLTLLIPGADYTGPDEFLYPQQVRIMGRIKAFNLRLPYSRPNLAVSAISPDVPAPLVFPWQYQSLQEMFASKSLRFERTEESWNAIREVVEAALHTRISYRTLRRHRQERLKTPHTGTLIGLSLAYMTRYTDILRVLGFFKRESNYHSLEALLRVDNLDALPENYPLLKSPLPGQKWSFLLQEWGEWPTLLSMAVPNLRSYQDRMIRVHNGQPFGGLDPIIPSGSMLLLDDVDGTPDTRGDEVKSDWERPIYVLRRGEQSLYGYLDANSERVTLLPHPRSVGRRISFTRQQISQLSRVVGAAVIA